MSGTAPVRITVEATHERGKAYLASSGWGKQETASTVKLGPFSATRKTATEARDAVAQQVTSWAAAWQTDGGTPVTVSFRGWTTIAWLAPDADGPCWQSITLRPDGTRRGTSSQDYVPRDELDAKLRLAAAQNVDPHDDADVAEALAFVGKWGGQAHEDAVKEFRSWVGFQRAYVAGRAQGMDDNAAHAWATPSRSREFAPAA